jgi:hypothetical protein
MGDVGGRKGNRQRLGRKSFMTESREGDGSSEKRIKSRKGKVSYLPLLSLEVTKLPLSR